MEANLICKKKCKLNKTPCREHRNSNNWGIICHLCLQFCSPDLAVLNSTPLKWLIFFTYPPACVWRTEYLRQSSALQLNQYQGAGDAQHCTNSLFRSLPLGWFDHLLLFSDTSSTTKRERERVLSVETSLKWKLLKRNNQLLIISHQKGCWNKHVQRG